MSHRLFNQSYSAGDEEPSINLTPLIDVVFVVLIAFIIVAPLLNYDGVELASGNSTLIHKNVNQQSPIVITVNASNTITLNHQPVDESLLNAQLSELKLRHPTAIPQLFHDQKASFGTYCRIKNALEEVGYQQLNVVLLPSKPYLPVKGK
jgi:biopolymer transport protein ExbD